MSRISRAEWAQTNQVRMNGHQVGELGIPSGAFSTQVAGPFPHTPDQSVWGGAGEFAFLTSPG